MASTSTQAVPSSSQEHVRVKQEEGYEAQKIEKKPVVRDPYHGHEETAKMSARFIISLFNCPVIPPQTGPNSPQPPLAHFIAYALHRTRLPHFVTLVGLLLLQRLKARYPSARGSSGHRLFISAFMIASKIVCDDTYSNQSWCIVAQKMFTLKEMNQMEREMCGYLEWNLNASSNEIDAFEAKVKAEHSSMAYNARKAAIKAQQASQQIEMARREQEQVKMQQAHQVQYQRPSSSGPRPMSGIDSASAQRVTAALPQRTPFTKAWASRPPSMTAVNSTGSSSSSSATASSSSRRLATPVSGSTPSPVVASAQAFHQRAPPTRVASTSSVPSQMATLSSSVNNLSNGHVAGSSMQSHHHRVHAIDGPTFHPGSTVPVVGNSPLTNGRRGSKPSIVGPNGKLTSASRSSSGWSLNMMNSNPNPVGSNGLNKRDETYFRSGELARSGSGAGTYVNTLSGRQYGVTGCEDEDEDDVDASGDVPRYAMAVSPGPTSLNDTIHSLSTTWPRTAGVPSRPLSSHGLQAPPSRTSRRQLFQNVRSNPSSPGSSTTHLHNSPYPSLTNDSSTSLARTANSVGRLARRTLSIGRHMRGPFHPR